MQCCVSFLVQPDRSPGILNCARVLLGYTTKIIIIVSHRFKQCCISFLVQPGRSPGIEICLRTTKIIIMFSRRYFGSCVLKASVDRVSVDTLGRYVDRQSADMSTDSRSIYRPILGRYVGRDSVDISADCRSMRMSGDTLRYFTATRPTLGGYFTDTRPALRSFGLLLLLSSIFSTQLLDNLF